MQPIDITRELLHAPVYPGDPAPALTPLSRMEYGDVCNTSALSLCVHNGTHLDAPRHFVDGGADIAELPLSRCIGECSVVEYDGMVTGAQLERVLHRLEKRILFKGDAQLHPSAAFVLAESGVELVGVEGPSVATGDFVTPVHRELLGAGILLLEGLDLSAAREGRYFLVAAPIRVAGADGAPVRAVLLESRL